MTAGNEEERREERRMEERGEEKRRGAGTRCAEIKEIKENDLKKKKKKIIRESKCSWSLRTSGGCVCLAVLAGGSGRGGGGVGSG